MPKDRIAIIGIGCRFPGGINHPDALWKLLVEGREAANPSTDHIIGRTHQAAPCWCATRPADLDAIGADA